MSQLKNFSNECMWIHECDWINVMNECGWMNKCL